MTNNDYRLKNFNLVYKLVPFILLLQIVQVIQLPTILVESLSIQSRTSVSSPFSTLKSSQSLVPRCISSTYVSNRISILRTTHISTSALSSPLYSSSDGNSSTNKTIEISNCDSETQANNVVEETAVDTGVIEASGDDGLLPSYKQLMIFTATTILIWLSEPLLSLVDTTIVGLTASAKSAVMQIAALGPATTLFDSLIYTTYFLAISTTNQLAPRLAMAKSSNQHISKANGKEVAINPWKELRQSTSHLLGLAIVFGSIVTAITFAFGRPIIGQMLGGATSMGVAEANAIVPLANNYARIRALVAPFSILGFVAQSFCLTTLDIATPAIAVAAASIINIIGDLALSPRYGIQGAAIATALATVASCSILLRKVRKTTNQWKTKQFEFEKATPTTEEANTNNNNRDIPFWSIPDKASLIDLFKLAGPIFFVMMAKVACYNLMTVRATSFGIIPLASHNIMMRVFFFFACFGDSLSQATQSFYPQVNKKVRGKLIKRLFYIASFIGVSNNVFSRQILSKLGRFLTKDPNIIEMMSTYSPWVGFAVFLHPFIMLLEGTVLAKRDLIFLIGSYAMTSLLHFGFVFSPVASTFEGLWRALFGFQLIRVVQFAIRVWQQSRATSNDRSSVGSVEQDGIPAPPL